MTSLDTTIGEFRVPADCFLAVSFLRSLNFVLSSPLVRGPGFLATQSPRLNRGCVASTSGMFLETILVAGGVGSSDLENRL